MRPVLLSAVCLGLGAMCVSEAAAAQAAPADGYLTPIGARNPSQAMEPFRLATRDQDGNRIIINGRPVSTGGSTLSPGGSFAFGTMRSASSGSTLAQTTLSAVSIGNSVSINNVKHSTIVITQTNNAEVSAQVNGVPANDNAAGGQN